MIREIRRIEPGSAVRIGFFMGLLAGFVFGLIEGLVLKFMAGSLGNLIASSESGGLGSLSGGAIFLLAIISGLVFSLLGALGGGVSAWFYNSVARLFGGLEVSVPDEESVRERDTADAGEEG